MDICARNGAVQGECHVDVSIGLGSPMQSGIRNDAEKIYRRPWETPMEECRFDSMAERTCEL